MSDLNDMEQRVLAHLVISSEGNGHDFGFTDDVDTESLGISRRQLAGYISQLSQKGYIYCLEGETFTDLSTGKRVSITTQFELTEKAKAEFVNL